MVCEPIVLCGTIPFMTKPIDVTATSAILPDLEQKPTYVNQMFASIAGRYDVMNRVMTGGQDQRWRRLIVKQCHLPLSLIHISEPTRPY